MNSAFLKYLKLWYRSCWSWRRFSIRMRQLKILVGEGSCLRSWEKMGRRCLNVFARLEFPLETLHPVDPPCSNFLRFLKVSDRLMDSTHAQTRSPTCRHAMGLGCWQNSRSQDVDDRPGGSSSLSAGSCISAHVFFTVHISSLWHLTTGSQVSGKLTTAG